MSEVWNLNLDLEYEHCSHHLGRKCMVYSCSLVQIRLLSKDIYGYTTSNNTEEFTNYTPSLLFFFQIWEMYVKDKEGRGES